MWKPSTEWQFEFLGFEFCFRISDSEFFLDAKKKDFFERPLQPLERYSNMDEKTKNFHREPSRLTVRTFYQNFLIRRVSRQLLHQRNRLGKAYSIICWITDLVNHWEVTVWSHLFSGKPIGAQWAILRWASTIAMVLNWESPTISKIDDRSILWALSLWSQLEFRFFRCLCFAFLC